MTDHLNIATSPVAIASSSKASPSLARLYWLALGTFAIGTEGFMIAPLLPEMASDLSVSLAGAGQLVTVFALTYALSSPVLTALTGSVDRRRLLIASMLAFAAANFVAWSAHDYTGLMTARILLALAAGLYMPSASALAGVVVGPKHRGTALAIVTGGSSLAVALGVPAGALVGSHFGWRLNFAAVGVMALIAAVGLISGLPRDITTRMPVASLRERLDVARRPAVLLALLGTMLWATGAFAVYTYLTSYLAAATGMAGTAVSAVLFAWGVAAVVGLRLGGRLSDHFGPLPVIAISLLVLTLAFASLSISPVLLPPAAVLPLILLAVVLWGVSAWAFYPAQQARLIGIAGTKVAPVALSLNASFQYLGFSMGAALGSLTVASISPLAIGWVGAGCVLASLSLVLATQPRAGSPALAAL
ncbi:Major facilitator superfamily MFS_1 [Mesorhizobium prunaredense]|uniref:Major facilitator superfamily MFS_1 n=1 Tax=Mesorhizobium prunaredense TaxID=1631249 RepID=A0A1R3V956_9HYPH|nr:MFS transporter [Mesorhizobium prunaredense]SIT54876.1 Major facilitator superfamily MFS_1 [Mesorhizobium prunaredense]